MITAIYARQSIDKKDSVSIETQINFCMREVIDSGQVETYVDKGYSGKNTDRPAFKRMMQGIKSKEIDKVIVYKLDRISRSVLDFSNLIEIFKQHNVEFRSTQEQFDTSSPIGNAMLNIAMVFAQLERETIQQRVIDNYYERGKKGYFMGGPPPFGFQRVKTTIEGKKVGVLEIIPQEAGIIEMIYDWYGNHNKTLSEIAAQLNQMELTSNIRKTSWDSVRVCMRLRNPIYVMANADVYNYYKGKGCIIENPIDDFVDQRACFIWGKRKSNDRKYTSVENHHVALCLHQGYIDPDLFLRCQFRLDNNHQINNSGSGKYTWLSGLVKCANCGRAMCIKYYNGKKGTVRYLSCSGAHSKICSKHRSHNTQQVEEYVQQELFQMITSHRNLVNTDKPSTPSVSQYANMQKVELAKIDEQIENLVREVASGSSVVTKYLTQEIERLESEKNKILNNTIKLQSNPTATKIMQLVDVIHLWDKMSLEDKKSIVIMLIERIELGENDIKIYWKHNFDMDENFLIPV